MRHPLCRSIVAKLVDLGEQEPRMHTLSMLFLLTYVFLLRLPSEALRLRARTGDHRVTVEGDAVVISLPGRKSRSAPCRLVRSCWCRSDPKTCPRHVVGEWVLSQESGCMLFQGISGGSALASLREMLGVLGVERHHVFRTHDLRRGHAKDLQLSGTRFPWCVVRANVCAQLQVRHCGRSWWQGNGKAQPSWHT